VDFKEHPALACKDPKVYPVHRGYVDFREHQALAHKDLKVYWVHKDQEA